MDITRSISEIIDILQNRCGLTRVTLDPQLVGVEFDAVLVGQDPLTVVALEHKERGDEKSLQRIIRKAQSFAWTTFTNHKLALLNLVLLVPDSLSQEVLQGVEKELSGTARLFVITEQMPRESVEQILSLLASPRVVGRALSAGKAATVENVLGDARAHTFRELALNATSAKEIESKLLDLFQSLISEVERETEKS